MKDFDRTPRIVGFGAYEVDLRAGELRKHGVKIKLREKSFDVLTLLLEHPGEVETLPRRGYRFVAPLSTPARGAEGAAPRKVRLAVLPFDNLSGDPAQEYFSDGMTEELITELACLAPEQLGVIARELERDVMEGSGHNGRGAVVQILAQRS